MGDVAGVLAEGFAVIADDDVDGLVVQAAGAEAVAQDAEGVVGDVQVVEVGVVVVGLGQGAGASPGAWYGWWPAMGMNTAKKRWSRGTPSTKVEQAARGGAIVDAEARAVGAVDAAGVDQRVEAALAHDGLHAQVREPARVKEARAQPGAREGLGGGRQGTRARRSPTPRRRAAARGRRSSRRSP